MPRILPTPCVGYTTKSPVVKPSFSGMVFSSFLRTDESRGLLNKGPRKPPAAKRVAAAETGHQGRRTFRASVHLNNTKCREKPEGSHATDASHPANYRIRLVFGRLRAAPVCRPA